MSERQAKGKFTQPHSSDEAIDEALREALDRKERAESELPLKRQWDDDLEAELQATLEGFDAQAITVPGGGRTRAADRAHVAKEDLGQEKREAPGPQHGKIVAIRGEDVFIDLGGKSEGLVPLHQFGENTPQVGQELEVYFDHYDRSEGLVVMSLKGAAVQATWENLREGIIVEARTVKEIKGGLQVEVNGIRGFLPISQIAIGRIEDTKPFLNQKLRAIVTEANQRERNLVVSVRDLLEEERAEQREKTWGELEEGQVRKGIVRSIKDFGVFVDMGGVDGLIHVSDLSWKRGQKPGDLVKLNDVLEVKVLKIDREKKKVGLGLKQLAPSPWDTVLDDYALGQTAKGKVTKIMDFGAFVELEAGIEGLIHISEMSNKRVYRVRDHVQEGQELEVRIVDIDPEARRIALSIKPLAITAPEPESPEDDESEKDTPPAPRPERKVPLKGGLGDRDSAPFTQPPRAPKKSPPPSETETEPKPATPEEPAPQA